MTRSTSLLASVFSLLLCAHGCGSPSPGSGDDATPDAGTSPDTSPDDDSDTGEDPDVGPIADAGSDADEPDARGDDSGGVVDDEEGALDRDADPVVLRGAQLPGLAAVQAEDVVAFARRDDAWVQIPLQVDERAVVDFCEIYGKSSGRWGAGTPPCKTNKVITTLFYTDPGTFTGPDPDPLLDGDDEVVFMARDAGGRAGEWSDPAGVVEGSGVELTLTDGDDTAWVYLFEREDASLDPGAGAQYVTYDFVLEGGVDYKTGYALDGPSCGGDDQTCNPASTEDSTIQGANYVRHFSARWLSDDLRITEGDATGVDILDVDQARFSPDSCGRHVLTFSTAEGAFVVNKSGPVRALRSYLGANSGPLTQRIHRFYDKREDVSTHLRVHSLSSGIMVLLDYSDEARGMTYANDSNPMGVTIDGVPDDVNQSAAPDWEIVTGPQGTLVMTTTMDITLDPSRLEGYWNDDEDTTLSQCDTSTILDAPDAQALGTSGTWYKGRLEDTDPKNGATEHFVGHRTMYFREPELAREDALELVAHARDPIAATARVVGATEICGDGECGAGEDGGCPVDCVAGYGGCGDGFCQPPENSVSCPADCPAEGDTASGCGDGVCDASVENELSCAGDCWQRPYDTIVACLDTTCDGVLDACANEADCVDMITCIAPCVRSGGSSINQCVSTCAAQVDPSQDDEDTATGLLMCGSAMSCF